MRYFASCLNHMIQSHCSGAIQRQPHPAQLRSSVPRKPVVGWLRGRVPITCCNSGGTARSSRFVWRRRHLRTTIHAAQLGVLWRMTQSSLWPQFQQNPWNLRADCCAQAGQGRRRTVLLRVPLQRIWLNSDGLAHYCQLTTTEYYCQHA